MFDVPADPAPSAADPGRRLAIALLVGVTLVLSRALACATPFAALAAVAGTRLRRRDALAAVLLGWGGNQLIGFALPHYPRTASTLGWGIAIGVAGCAAAAAATLVPAQPERGSPAGAAWRMALALATSFSIYEGVLFAATALLPSSHAALTPAVIARLAAVNLLGCAVLSVAWQLAGRCGMHPRSAGAVGQG